MTPIASLARGGLAMLAVAMIALPLLPAAGRAEMNSGEQLLAGRAAPSATSPGQGRAERRPHVHRSRSAVVAGSGSAAPMLRRGAGYARVRGSERVRWLQRRLRRLGYRPGAVDGLFGPRTAGAVRWFQSERGLAASGTVAAATLRQLRLRADGSRARRGERRHEPLAADRGAEAPATPTTAGSDRVPERRDAPSESGGGATSTSPPAPSGSPTGGVSPELDAEAVDAILVAVLALGLVVLLGGYLRTRAQLAHLRRFEGSRSREWLGEQPRVPARGGGQKPSVGLAAGDGGQER